jgi:stigma-specific protein Stig1
LTTALAAHYGRRMRYLAIALAALSACGGSGSYYYGAVPDGGVRDLAGSPGRHDLAGGARDLSLVIDLSNGLCGNCPQSQCCGGACVDTAHDVFNCGTCGNVCAADESCESGQCTPPDMGPPQQVDLATPPDAGSCACKKMCQQGCAFGCCFEDVLAMTCAPNPMCFGG